MNKLGFIALTLGFTLCSSLSFAQSLDERCQAMTNFNGILAKTIRIVQEVPGLEQGSDIQALLNVAMSDSTSGRQDQSCPDDSRQRVDTLSDPTLTAKDRQDCPIYSSAVDQLYTAVTLWYNYANDGDGAWGSALDKTNRAWRRVRYEFGPSRLRPCY